MKTSRLEAFSDGIFAIAATLLILDVTADATGAGLGAELRHSWPQYAAYAFGFLVIGIWWVNHHVYMEALRKTDRIHLFLNVMFMSCIAFLPFPIRLVAKHVWDDGARAAVVTYGLTTTTAALFAILTWLYAAHDRRLISNKISDEALKKITRSIIPGVPVNGAATLVAFWNPHVGIILLLALTLFYVVGTSFSDRQELGIDEK